MHPTTLHPGSIVGSWRLLALASQGSFGVVFRAESTTTPESGPAALKFALQPGDPRFALEAKLLSVMQHPNLPRLRDSGEWSSAAGATYSFIVMDWVEGLPLYAWARLRPRSSREVLRVLAQGASALHAIHAVGGLHRDVKGDHFLVRPEDGRAVLVDFGSCTFPGAPAITRNSGPPSTPQYRSPQSQLHQWRLSTDPSARYEVSPADDVYALGVTAYRLVTGHYPLVAERLGTEEGLDSDSADFPTWVPADALVRLSPELARWIRQMISLQPEARGTPVELAVGLKRSADTEGPEADLPVGPRKVPARAKRAAPSVPPPSAAPWNLGLRAAVLGFLLVTTGGGLFHALLKQPSTGPLEPSMTASPPGEQADTSGLGEITLPEPLGPAEPEPDRNSVTASIPESPLPGQRLPPCKKPLFEINGGCWSLVGNETPPCSDITYEWRKRCYLPFMAPYRPANTQEK